MRIQTCYKLWRVVVKFNTRWLCATAWDEITYPFLNLNGAWSSCLQTSVPWSWTTDFLRHERLIRLSVNPQLIDSTYIQKALLYESLKPKSWKSLRIGGIYLEDTCYRSKVLLLCLLYLGMHQGYTCILCMNIWKNMHLFYVLAKYSWSIFLALG